MARVGSARRNDSPSTGDFYYGAPGSDLGKTAFAAVRGGAVLQDAFGEAYTPIDSPSGAGVALGRFTFADATIGLVTMALILSWYAGRGLKA